MSCDAEFSGEGRFYICCPIWRRWRRETTGHWTVAKDDRDGEKVAVFISSQAVVAEKRGERDVGTIPRNYWSQPQSVAELRRAR